MSPYRTPSPPPTPVRVRRRRYRDPWHPVAVLVVFAFLAVIYTSVSPLAFVLGLCVSAVVIVALEFRS